MPCNNPPPLSDETISAILDGDTTPETEAHLQQCGDCAARLVEARQWEHAIAGQLHRWDCPSPQELGDYHLGSVTQARQRSIAAHLDVCVRCSAEIEDLRVFVADEVAAPIRSTETTTGQSQPRGRLRAMVAQLLPRTPGFAGAALRGSGDGPMIAQCSAATIVLEAQQLEQQTVRLTGQIADEAGEQERWDGALVEVRQDNVLIAVAFVDDLGGFNYGPLGKGTTGLSITAADGTWIVVEDLDL